MMEFTVMPEQRGQLENVWHSEVGTLLLAFKEHYVRLIKERLLTSCSTEAQVLRERERAYGVNEFFAMLKQTIEGDKDALASGEKGPIVE
jgi:hypothetical protein